MFHDLLHFFGYGICHQLEDRSLAASGSALAVCARDTGIYIGIFSTLIYFHFSKRNKYLAIPSIKHSLLLLLFLIPLMLDGVGSYLHLFESNNIRRLVTGILFGYVLPYFLYPLLSYTPALIKNHEQIVNHHKDLWIPLLMSCLLGIVFYLQLLPHLVLDSLIIGTVLVWFSLCFSFFVKFNNRKYVKWILSLLVSVLFLTILSATHSLIVV